LESRTAMVPSQQFVAMGEVADWIRNAAAG
jgi:hypothetical protein